MSFVVDGKPGAYASQDGRSRVMKDLGFTIPARFDELAGSAFYFSVSAEKLDVLDTDVLVWIVGSDAGLRTIAELSLRPSLRAVTEGREVVADALLSGAFSFGSPLSLEYLLTKLVPELALAVDGKPATVVPSATLLARPGGSPTTSAGATAATTASAPAAAASTLTPEQQTVAEAFAAVFDSKVAFDAKSSSLAEPTVVRTAAEAYGKAGSAMGGIILKPTAVAIQGDTAVITYDVLFGGTAAYKDLSKTITRVDGHWVVPTKEFCAFLSSARVPCP